MSVVSVTWKQICTKRSPHARWYWGGWTTQSGCIQRKKYLRHQELTLLVAHFADVDNIVRWCISTSTEDAAKLRKPNLYIMLGVLQRMLSTVYGAAEKWKGETGDWSNLCNEELHISRILQGGSNMTGTDLYVNKPHCAAAVRPRESEATTSTLPPAHVRTCPVLSGSC